MSQINISNLTFAYDGSIDTVFENVSFQIDTNWKLGLIGRNGKGKTTLLRLLAGELVYSGGITASTEFAYFPFAVPDKSRNTIDIIDSICPEYAYWQLARELSLLKTEEDILYRPFSTLSGGEQAKVLLASLFIRENRFLLIDEPTNHLDLTGRQIVSEYLNTKKGFILVSHDRNFLDNCVDHILSFNRSDIEVQKGNFSSWKHNRELRDSFELAENSKRKKEIKRLGEAAKSTAGWSDKLEQTKCGSKNSGLRPDRGYIGHKAAKMMSRSKAIEKRREAAVQEKTKLLKNIEEIEELKLFPLPYRAQRLAGFEKVSIRCGDKTVCREVSFAINRGDRIALCGKNGSGKSSILKLLCGEDFSYTGTVHKGGGLIISYIPQDISFLKGELSDFSREQGLDESLFRAILRKLDFSREQFEKDMRLYSAGQKKKVLLAKSLCEKAHLYIWDEPLNYIDLFSRMQIETLILEFMPTLLFVEHDAAFLDKIATKTVNLP